MFFKVYKMIENYRVIDIQIYHDSQWSSFYKTYDDINVIYRVFTLIQSQVKDQKLRIIDGKGNIIDPLILSNNRKMRKQYFSPINIWSLFFYDLNCSDLRPIDNTMPAPYWTSRSALAKVTFWASMWTHVFVTTEFTRILMQAR